MGRELDRRAKSGRRGGRLGKLVKALVWQHRWGSKVKGWLKQIEHDIEPPPQFFEQPEIEPHQKLYWDAFHELSTERQIGMGAGPIPRSAIKVYADELGIVGDDYDPFHLIIRKMDNEYLSLLHSSHKSQDKGLTAEAGDPERTRAVMEVIKARAAAANKRQVKRKTH